MKRAGKKQVVIADNAHRGMRRAYWAVLGDFKDTPVFDLAALEPGNIITGPALIEARDTTYVIEPRWRLTLDTYRNGVLEQTEG